MAFLVEGVLFEAFSSEDNWLNVIALEILFVTFSINCTTFLNIFHIPIICYKDSIVNNREICVILPHTDAYYGKYPCAPPPPLILFYPERITHACS